MRTRERAGLKNVETRVLDGENLKLPDDSFDSVVSRLGVMVFPHLQKAVTGIRKRRTLGKRFVAKWNSPRLAFGSPGRANWFSLLERNNG